MKDERTIFPKRAMIKERTTKYERAIITERTIEPERARCAERTTKYERAL